MQCNPLWPVGHRFPTLERDLRKDVVVVGGGMAGLASAYQLKEAGYDVALVEREEVGGPATGASSGVLYYGSGTNLVPAIGLFGEEKAGLLWKETARVISDIARMARAGKIDCGIRTCGSVMVAKNAREEAEIEREFSAAKRLGLPVRLLKGSEVHDYYPLKEFTSGLAFDAVGQVHPARFGAGVAVLEGLEVYENTPMLGWKNEGDGVSVMTPKGVISSSKVLLATNIEPLYGLADYFDVESSVILASKPTPRVRDVFPEEKIFWSMEDKYDLVYPRGDRLILELYALGEEEEKLRYYFPGVEFELEKQWGEAWAKPRDWFPIVGRLEEDVFAAVGMGDQGIIMSWLTGLKIPGILEGKGDWFADMSSPARFGIGKEGREVLRS
ncbi:MAG: FAD-binding oxidoreductase [Thaumarchaeota archaeon]|nr:FAD-binding oxidoreductase [Nitrososphaerota archaeon]